MLWVRNMEKTLLKICVFLVGLSGFLLIAFNSNISVAIGVSILFLHRRLKDVLDYEKNIANYFFNIFGRMPK